MNILFVADVSISDDKSGSERVLYEQSTYLARREHEVYLLTRKLPSHDSQEETIDGIKEWRYKFQKKLPYPFLRSILFNCRRSFDAIMRNSPCDVINFHQPFSTVGVLCSQASHSIPKVYTCHSLSFEEYISRSSPPRNLKEWMLNLLQVHTRRLTEKIVLRKADRIVVLSDYMREKLQKVYDLTPGKIHVIPGGVDLSSFTPPENKLAIRRHCGFPEDRFILLTIRNLEPRMGLENLILAFKKILDEKVRASLILGGDGPLMLDLKQCSIEAGVADFVTFTGYIPEEELPSYYQMADLFILPTEELEGFGLVTVEALASGLPVLGTPVGGTKEILAHMGSRFLFADAKPDSMANQILETIRSWAGDPETYNKISRKCRKVAEDHYSWDDHVAKLENLFQLVIQQRSSSLSSDP